MSALSFIRRQLKKVASFLKYALLALLLPCAEKSLLGQIPNLEYIPSVRFGVVTPEVRNWLAAEWDSHALDNPYLERGYCGRVELGRWAGELAYIVTSVAVPDTVLRQTTTGIEFRCYAWNSVPIHVHPPRNCPEKNMPCAIDGMYAYQCLPSDSDRASLKYFEFPFGIVQCERKALRTIWPTGVAGA